MMDYLRIGFHTSSSIAAKNLLLLLLSSTTLDGFWPAQVFLANIFCQKQISSETDLFQNLDQSVTD
jgi:hypothetical protein